MSPAQPAIIDTVPENDSLDDTSVDSREEIQSDGEAVRRSQRTVRQPERFGQNLGNILEHVALMSMSADVCIPQSASEGLADPNWKSAMEREFKSLAENSVWTLTERPKDRPVITGKWHFVRKLNSEGETVKYKARFVARGFTQTPGVDYDETYSPTTNLSTIRIVLALGVQRGMSFYQMDIKTAYLNAPIVEDIFMEQPEGFVEGGKHLVCKLQKSLYGLKQSGRNWYHCLSEHLEKLGFVSSVHDKCLWSATIKSHACWIAVWVDDIMYGSAMPEMQWVRSSLLVRILNCRGFWAYRSIQRTMRSACAARLTSRRCWQSSK